MRKKILYDHQTLVKLSAVFGPGIASLAAQQQLDALRSGVAAAAATAAAVVSHAAAGGSSSGGGDSAPATPGRRARDSGSGGGHFWASTGGGDRLVATTPQHASSSSSSAASAAPCSPYLECVFALLRRLDVYLDVVSAVGRTIEEERLPQLFPAEGHPRALFRDALRRAAQASGSVSSTPIHNRGSLRFLRNAAALMLLVQEFAWRQQLRGAPAPGGAHGPAAGPAPPAPHSPSPHSIRAIVNTNLGDATSLLVSCGIPADVAAMLVGPLLGGGRGSGGGPSPSSLAGLSDDPAGGVPALLSEILATVVAEDAPATLRGLVAIVDSTLAYCRRLRAAAEEHLRVAAAEEAVAAGGGAAGSTSATAAAKLRPSSQSAAAAGGGGGGLFAGGGLLGSVAGMLGLGGSAAPRADAPSRLSLPATPNTDSEEQAALAEAVRSDPILQALTQCHVPLLAAFRLRLHRKPDTGAIGLVLAPVNHALAVRGGGRLESTAETQQLLHAGPPAPPPTSASAFGGGGFSRARAASGAPGLRGKKGALPPLAGDDSEDALAVGAALGELLDQQHAWLGAQIRDSEACIGGLVLPLTSAVTAAGPAPPALAIGDILTRTEATALAGLPFEEVVRTLGAAPRSAVLEFVRIVDVPAVEVLGLLLLALRQQQQV